MSPSHSNGVTYELHHDYLEEGPFIIKRVEVVGEFATREEARQFMIKTTAERHHGVERNQRWRYKPNRGSGTFTIVDVGHERVTLRDFHGKDKTVSLRTLRGDYERVPR